jgi:hypothetical protein
MAPMIPPIWPAGKPLAVFPLAMPHVAIPPFVLVHNADSGRKPRIPHSGDPAGYGKRCLMRCQLRSRLKIERCPRQIAVDCKSLSRHSPVVRLTHAPAPGLQSTAIMGPQPHLAGTAKIAIDCNRTISSSACSQLQMGEVPVAERDGEGRRYAIAPKRRFVMSEDA